MCERTQSRIHTFTFPLVCEKELKVESPHFTSLQFTFQLVREKELKVESPQFTFRRSIFQHWVFSMFGERTQSRISSEDPVISSDMVRRFAFSIHMVFVYIFLLQHGCTLSSDTVQRFDFKWRCINFDIVNVSTSKYMLVWSSWLCQDPNLSEMKIGDWKSTLSIKIRSPFDIVKVSISHFYGNIWCITLLSLECQG